jgi:hypothetical protein
MAGFNALCFFSIAYYPTDRKRQGTYKGSRCSSCLIANKSPKDMAMVQYLLGQRSSDNLERIEKVIQRERERSS